MKSKTNNEVAIAARKSQKHDRSTPMTHLNAYFIHLDASSRRLREHLGLQTHYCDPSLINSSRLETVLQALAARAHNLIPRNGQHLFLFAALLDLSPRVDEAADEAEGNGADRAKGDGRVEEDEAGQRDRQLVERAHHAVRGRRRYAHAPRRRVRDEDRRQPRQDHREDDRVAVRHREVE